MLRQKTTSSTFIEYKLQAAICKYLLSQYPHVMFSSDTISNVKLSGPQKLRNSKLQHPDFSVPDLAIYHPTNTYHGLFLELKAANPYTLSGTLKKMMKKRLDRNGNVIEVYDHYAEQDRSLRRLRNLGYKAEFCWELDDAIKIIKEYLKS
jgi:hypothetical protein